MTVEKVGATRAGTNEMEPRVFVCFRFQREELQLQHRRLSRARVPERWDVRRRRQHLQLPVQTGVYRFLFRYVTSTTLAGFDGSSPGDQRSVFWGT